MNLARTFRLIVASISIMAVTAGPVAARTAVEPSTLNPPPPDFFNATCYDQARGTVCDLAFSDPPIVDEPSGIVCGADELLISQTRSVVGKRFYNADGNLTQRHFREFMAGTFTNPATGLSAPWIQHDTIVHNLAVAGDLGTGTIAVTGLLTRVWLPDGGTILMDAGTLVWDESTGELIREGGPHPFDAYFGRGDLSALQPICEALA